MATALLLVAGLWMLRLYWRGVGCWRRAVIYSALTWGALVVASTEILSATERLAPGPLIASWCGIIVALAMVDCWRSSRRARGNVSESRPSQSPPSLEHGPATFPLLPAAALCVVIALVAITAILSPPNTYDSLTYHMPRVMHWVQQKSVHHYPTGNDRQLWNSPWSEFAIAQTVILSGGDRLANLVQFGSMLVGLAAVSLIAKQFGAGPRGQFLAAMVAATIPMAVLQGSSTQTDWNVSCWVVCLLATLIDAVQNLKNDSQVSKFNPAVYLAAGTSLGLALLTKGTAYIFCAPLVGWLAWSSVRRPRWNNVFGVALVPLLAVLINAPHWSRNVEQFGSPLAPPGTSASLRNETTDPRFWLSNLIRDAAVHFHLRSRTLDDLLVIRPINKLHHWIGIDASDPRTTIANESFSIPTLSTHEDYAGNPLHVLLLVGAVVIAARDAMRSRNSSLGWYAAALLGMALLFAAALKWQIWTSRLQLPLFVAGAPLIAVAFWRHARSATANLWAAGLLICALPFALGGAPRALVGRNNVWTTSRADLYAVGLPNHVRRNYEEAVRRIQAAGMRDVGMMLDYNAPEYLLWVALNPSGQGPIQIHHVPPDGPLVRVGQRPAVPPPELLLVARSDGSARVETGGQVFNVVWSSGELALFQSQQLVAGVDPRLTLRR